MPLFLSREIYMYFYEGKFYIFTGGTEMGKVIKSVFAYLFMFVIGVCTGSMIQQIACADDTYSYWFSKGGKILYGAKLEEFT